MVGEQLDMCLPFHSFPCLSETDWIVFLSSNRCRYVSDCKVIEASPHRREKVKPDVQDAFSSAREDMKARGKRNWNSPNAIVTITQ
jgi:hypothetical protein